MTTTTPEYSYDVLILGAGPAGIAAARHLQTLQTEKKNANNSTLSFCVLEARSRVGGRATTSDELWSRETDGNNATRQQQRPLDHGARWIHGSCAENSIVKLLMKEQEEQSSSIFQNLVEAQGIHYKICLPWQDDDDNKAKDDANLDTTNDNKTPPPFSASAFAEAKQLEHMIVERVGDPRNRIPTHCMTRILTKDASTDAILSKEVSQSAHKIARLVFQETIQSAMKDPHQKINPTDGKISIPHEDMEDASLMDVLLWLHQQEQNPSSSPAMKQDSNNNQHEKFASLCRDVIVAQNPHVVREVSVLASDNARDEFLAEVVALFHLEIYTFFESWEGAPIHQISAQYGMEGTCLGGGNTILACGYGGLIQRLAHPLLQDNTIRLEHQVIAIETNTTTTTDSGSSSDGTTPTKIVVRVDHNGTTKELHCSVCIVALPLGVLRAAINPPTDDANTSNNFFQPELPLPLQTSIRSLGIAVRNKIELLFPTRWWPEHIGRIKLACTHLQQSPTYHPYTTFIVESAASSSAEKDDDYNPNILVCYVAGAFAEETEQKPNAQIQTEIMTVLRQAQLADTTLPDPISIHVTRWLSDPYSRGSWTFYRHGSKPDDVREFRSNSECHKRGLFFAGEHTCDGSVVPGDDMGCVHGAWLSGELAAEAALKRLVEK